MLPSTLSSGSSRTGKTIAAAALARELGLGLYNVDFSRVVSKCIGDTENNLASVFDEADASSALLLFDEAVVLFGKRTDVCDAHDRYAEAAGE